MAGSAKGWVKELLSLVLIASLAQRSVAISNKDVIIAVNAGGPAVVDSNGIRYKSDVNSDTPGTASDYGMQSRITGVPAADIPLYQTERYHEATFGYKLPSLDDGDYVLVTKFSEVYWDQSNMKVFHIHLGGLEAVSNLDIFDTVGKGHAHDEIIPFTISGGRKFITVNDQKGPLQTPLTLAFVKTNIENPKVCAFYVARGTEDSLNIKRPQPPHIPGVDDIDDDQDLVQEIEEDEFIIEDDSGHERQVRTPRANSEMTTTPFSVSVAFVAIVSLGVVLLAVGGYLVMGVNGTQDKEAAEKKGQ